MSAVSIDRDPGAVNLPGFAAGDKIRLDRPGRMTLISCELVGASACGLTVRAGAAVTLYPWSSIAAVYREDGND